MLGFGSEIYGQGTHGKGVMKGWVGITQPVSTYFSSSEAEWYSWVHVQANATFGAFGGVILGAYSSISPSSKMIASGIKMTWDGAVPLGVVNSTVMAFGHIAWDGQLVDDTTWTTQEVD